MLKHVMAVATVAMLLLPTTARGDTYTSSKYGFSAEFPAAPVVSEPKGSETDAAGNFIATMVMISDQTPGTYSTLVTVDSYVVPKKLNATATLRAMRDDFIHGMGAKLISSDPGTRDGYQALFFSYDSPGHAAAGNGIVIIVPKTNPRTYLVVTMHTPTASADDIVGLSTFLSTFHIK